MKVLLDESVPVRLAHSFPQNFMVETVQSMGWNGTKNRKLLRLAKENEGFYLTRTVRDYLKLHYPNQF